MPTQHSINLTWNASPGADPAIAYNIYRGTVTGGPYSKVNATAVSTTNYSDATGSGGVTYFYVVAAVDAAGNESVFSNEVSATMLQNPNAPSGLTATAV